MSSASEQPNGKVAYLLVDVGCIECGEQTIVRGVFDTREEVANAMESVTKALGIEKWEPRGGFLEMVPGIPKDSENTYRAGCGYFTGGQRALEIHEVQRGA